MVPTCCRESEALGGETIFNLPAAKKRARRLQTNRLLQERVHGGSDTDEMFEHTYTHTRTHTNQCCCPRAHTPVMDAVTPPKCSCKCVCF